MTTQAQFHDLDVIHQAMANYLINAAEAKKKRKQIKASMEYRRKLEIKWEERRLAMEILEFDFN